LWSVASPARTGRSATKTSKSKAASSTRSGQLKVKPALPRFVSLETIKTLRELQLARPKSMADPLLPILAPRLDGKKLPRSLQTLPGARRMTESDFKKITRASAQRRARRVPRFPISIAPARIGSATRNAPPRWVRYPLEFQLGGVSLGTLAVNKDRFNRIDRYGLFAMHGNPTAIVVPVRQAAVTGGPGGMGMGGPPPGMGGPPGGGGGGGQTAGTSDVMPGTLSVQQQPPEFSPRFADSQNGSVPAWANAALVDLDENHVLWLYNRGTYAMGFAVDRLGYVDAIVVAGTQSGIANTQLEDPEHTIRLGDDLRKVMFRYGYPDSFNTYTVSTGGGAGGGAPGGGAPGGMGGPPGGMGGPPGGGAPGGGGAGGGGTNNINRVFELRYEQSYNVVFTVSYNRVVRMYIFGDPDYFNEARRNRLRTQY
jgi:hypothetical protein